MREKRCGFYCKFAPCITIINAPSSVLSLTYSPISRRSLAIVLFTPIFHTHSSRTSYCLAYSCTWLYSKIWIPEGESGKNEELEGVGFHNLPGLCFCPASFCRYLPLAPLGSIYLERFQTVNGIFLMIFRGNFWIISIHRWEWEIRKINLEFRKLNSQVIT